MAIVPSGAITSNAITMNQQSETSHTMPYQLVSQPCRNFNILGSLPILDPVDGREKMVLSNFAAGSTGNLIFVDPETGAGESVSLPEDDGAWALFNLNNETLLVGTCPRGGYLHRLDLATRGWAEPLRCPTETYIWNLCQGDDGMIYGGTYPGCLLLRYDPVAHELVNIGRMSTDQANLYSRFVYAIPGHILVECWSAAHHLTLYELATGAIKPFGLPGAKVKTITDDFICTVTTATTGTSERNGTLVPGEELHFYDPRTLNEMPDQSDRLPSAPALPYSGVRHLHTLQDGRGFGVRGQEYFVMPPDVITPDVIPPDVTPFNETAPPLQQIPTERPPTRIHTITAAPDGKIWGSCGFGQTIFSCDPATGAYWNANAVCDRGGEVYGMAFANKRLYLSAYSGGDHVVYDPAEPWDQVNNRNPHTLESVGPALIRPEANSVIGPDGHFWTGWMAEYGRYGGGISRVNTGTGDVTVWPEPVPEQPIVGLTADERYLYFTTGGGGNGLSPKVEPFHFVVWAGDGGTVWDAQFAAGQKLGRLCATEKSVVVVVDETIQLFDPAAMGWRQTIPLAEPCTTVLALPNGTVAIFGKTALWHFDPISCDLTKFCDLPGAVGTATIGADGALYFASGVNLYRLNLA